MIERKDDKWGIGANAEGEIEVLSPEEYARRVAVRNAEEAEDAKGDAGEKTAPQAG